MLKIVSSCGAGEQRWTLCGQLAGPWVKELRESWEKTRDGSDTRKRVVDLREVTFIDENGEGLLHQMRREGAEFIATGVDTKDVLNNLAQSGKRALRKFLPHLGNEFDQSGMGDGKEEGKSE